MAHEAFWLPGWERVPTRPQAAGGLTLAVPDLTPADLTALAAQLRQARVQYLADRTTADLLHTLDQVARRWQDPHDPLYRLAVAALPAITGYAPSMVAAALSRMARRADAAGLAAVLAAELPDPAALDAFVPHPGGAGQTRAVGPELAGFVFSGNVPGIPAYQLALGLVSRAACLAKTAAGEPLFGALWCRSVAEIDPDLGRCLACTYWPGTDRDLHRSAFASAAVVVAFGAGPAVAALGAALPPSCRYVVHGPALSIGSVAREALTAAGLADLVGRAARDVAEFDQQGCVSPQRLYVEAGGEVDPACFAAALAGALSDLQVTWPRAALAPAAAAALQVARSEYRFETGVRVWASPGTTDWTVVLVPAGVELVPAPLNRFIVVQPVDDLAAVPAALAGWRGQLQTCGFAGPAERALALAAALAPLGVSRLCPLGTVQRPHPAWHHDGGPNLLPFLRWIDVEGSDDGGTTP